MFRTRIRELREAKGFKTQAEFAKAFGVSQPTVAHWEAGDRQPGQKKTAELADFYGVTVDDLLGRMEDTPKRKGRRIPVLGYVAAGIPIEAVEEILDYEEIDEALAATGEFFGLCIKGHSMEPRMMEGDVVIVRQQETADTGDTVVVLVNGGEATVKKIKIGPAGITLLPTNPTYDPMYFTCEEVESLPVRIIGKVVELRAKF